MENYYNSLSREEQLLQLGKCDFMASSEFVNGVQKLKNKKVTIHRNKQSSQFIGTLQTL